MKTKFLSFSILFLLLSCSKNDDNNLDLSLLYGQWFYADYCNDQNFLILNSNKTYNNTFSGNTCDTNDRNTTQYTGTYSINGSKISFETLTEQIIIAGDNPPITSNDFGFLYQKIVVLTENELIIEAKFSDNTSYFTRYVRN